jgi:hypothetical protein
MEDIVNDEVLARALLDSDRKPLVVVWCPQHQHRTGKAYWLPDGDRLAIRGWKMRWATFPLAPEFDTDGVHIDMRCSCGTSNVNRVQVRETARAALADRETRTIVANWTFRPVVKRRPAGPSGT